MKKASPYEADGADGVLSYGETLSETVRVLMLLLGARTVAELTRLPVRLGTTLQGWLDKDLQQASANPRLARTSLATGPQNEFAS